MKPLIALAVSTAVLPASASNAASPAGFFCSLEPSSRQGSDADRRTLVIAAPAGFDRAGAVLHSDDGGVLAGARQVIAQPIATKDGLRTIGFTAGSMMMIVKQSPNQPEYFNAVLGQSPSSTSHQGLCHLITGAKAIELVAMLGGSNGRQR